MKKRILPLVLLSMCLVACGSTEEKGTTETVTAETTENETTVEKTTENESTSVSAGVSDVELKEVTLDEIKNMITDASFDWNTLPTAYKMESVSEEDSASFYLANFEYDNKSFELYAQAGIVGQESEDISLVYVQNSENKIMLTLYHADESEQDCTVEKLDEFVNKDESLSNYLTAEVPEGYKTGTYQSGLEGMFKGCLLYKEDEEEKNAGVAYSMRHAGVFVCTDESEILRYDEDGNLTDIKGSAINNTFDAKEGFEKVDLLEGCQILIGKGQLEDYVQQNDEYETSEFWYVFIDRNDDEICYMLYFSTTDFTKDEAIEIVKTIEFTER